MYAVKSKNGIGVFNGHEWLVDPEYQWIGFFHSGFAFARTKNGSECLIDADGNQTTVHEIASNFCPADSVEFIAPNDAINSPGSLVIESGSGWTVLSLDRRLQPHPIGTFPRGCNVAVYFGGNWLIARVSHASKQ